MKKFELIYNELKQKIANKSLPAGSKIPSENQLCQDFNCSRGTLRKALELLAQDGLINAQHGRGVFVLDHEQITFSFGSLISFAEANQDSGSTFTTEIALCQSLICDTPLASVTGFAAETPLLKLLRLRTLNNEKIIADLNYFNTNLITGLNQDIAQKSIYHYIESELKLKIGFARRSIEVCAPNDYDLEYLDLSQFNCVVVVKNWVYLADGVLFEYTESHHRPDKFVFTEFVRRR
jgi:GntR family trehalose operon transcriptional repressor